MRLIDAHKLRKRVHGTLFTNEKGEVIHGELEKAIRRQMEQLIKNAPEERMRTE